MRFVSTKQELLLVQCHDRRRECLELNCKTVDLRFLLFQHAQVVYLQIAEIAALDNLIDETARRSAETF